MRSWISLAAGIIAGFLMLLGLHAWLVEGDNSQGAILLACASAILPMIAVYGRKSCPETRG